MQDSITSTFEGAASPSWWDQTWGWVATNGLKIVLIATAGYLIVHIGSRFLTKIVRQFVKIHHRYGTEKDIRQRADTLNSIVGTSFTVFVWLVVIMIILSEVGVNIGPLIAGAGVAGIAIGFGAQSLIKDFLSGLFIITENQYRVGDVVRLNNASGIVEAVTMRTTILRDLDGNVHHIPNGEIKVSTNMTLEHSAVNLDVGVSYDSDLKLVENVINKVGADLANSKNWHKKIIEAPRFERVDDFGDSAIVIKILGKTKPMEQWNVMGELRKRLKIAFDKEGIEIPLPQRVIHQAKK